VAGYPASRLAGRLEEFMLVICLFNRNLFLSQFINISRQLASI
jgi:hypothetical protein